MSSIFEASLFSKFTENYSNQNFSLPIPLIYYISHECPLALRKLLFTCKYFYLKFGIVPCILSENIWVASNDGKWGPLKYPRESPPTLPKRIWLHYDIDGIPTSHISRFIKMSYRCDLQSLRLSKQTLAFNEFKFLVASQTLRDFICHAAITYSEDGSLVPMEVVLATVPTIIDFSFSIPHVLMTSNGYTFQSAQKIAQLSRPVKLKHLHLGRLPGNFNLLAFRRFVLKNVASSSYFIIRFEKDVPRKFIDKFRKSIKSMIDPLRIQGRTLEFGAA